MNNDYAPIYTKYVKEYDFTNDGVKFKKTTSDYAIKAYLLEDVLFYNVKDDEKCIEMMLNKLKETNFYEIKNDAEINEFMEFLKDNSNLQEILKSEDDEEDDDFDINSISDINIY